MFFFDQDISHYCSAGESLEMCLFFSSSGFFFVMYDSNKNADKQPVCAVHILLFVFVVGLDLCYGRWDNSLHRLTDFGSAVVPPAVNKTVTV